MSLLLDPNEMLNDEPQTPGTEAITPQLPSKKELQERVVEFKKSLHLPPEKCREIELKTREQSMTLLWYAVRRYRITASYFGHIRRRLLNTPPSLSSVTNAENVVFYFSSYSSTYDINSLLAMMNSTPLGLYNNIINPILGLYLMQLCIILVKLTHLGGEMPLLLPPSNSCRRLLSYQFLLCFSYKW